MTVFTIIGRKANPDLAAAIERTYSEADRFEVNEMAWLVSDPATARDVATKLGIKRGGITGAVVLPSTGSYYGVASTQLWEWMRVQIERDFDD